MFNQIDYISKYNKDKYKMYQFRVKKNDYDVIDYLDKLNNKNAFIIDLIRNSIEKNQVYTIKYIKNQILPVMDKYSIQNVYLFGSYARGEATPQSDIDIYCDKGTIKTLIDQDEFVEMLESSLNKKVDIVFTSSRMTEEFYQNIKEDMIKIC